MAGEAPVEGDHRAEAGGGRDAEQAGVVRGLRNAPRHSPGQAGRAADQQGKQRGRFFNRACVMAIDVRLIVTDVSPLIALAVARSLDYLPYPALPVLIPDAATGADIAAPTAPATGPCAD